MKSLQLTVINGPNRGRWLKADEADELIVGRGASTPLTIVDARMSRRHFAVSAQESGWQLTDLDSSNGTSVNGESVSRTILHEGDTIVAGDTIFQVELAGSLSGTQRVDSFCR